MKNNSVRARREYNAHISELRTRRVYRFPKFQILHEKGLVRDSTVL